MTLHAPPQSVAFTPATRADACTIAAVVFLFAIACYIPLPPDTPLAGAEAQRAITAHQMVESGEWFVPRLFGRIYLAKPPLHYWIEASFERLAGTTSPWIWRLPSTLGAALLAAALGVIGARWFGRVGGWVSGFSYLAIFPLWSENRVADIDISNTVFATLATICLIELHFGKPRRRWLWILAAGLTTGASIMVKGHAGLTIVGGAMIWIAITHIRRKHARILGKPAYWLPLLIGLLLFTAYAVACVAYLKARGWPLDLEGLKEGARNISLGGRRFIQWLILPPTLFIYSLPLSLALLIAFRRDIRGEEDSHAARLIPALAGSVLVAWGICFVTGMHMPRYGFVTMPLLAPLVGGIASRIPALDARAVRNTALTVGITAALFATVAVVLTIKVWKIPQTRVLLAPVSIVAVGLAGWIVARLLRGPDWRAAWALPVVLVLASIPFAAFRHHDRLARTCRPQAQAIRAIVGDNGSLMTCYVGRWQPELLYYTGLPTRAPNAKLLDWQRVPPGTWVVLSEEEMNNWQAQVPSRIAHVSKFVANKNNVYLVRYQSEP